MLFFCIATDGSRTLTCQTLVKTNNNSMKCEANGVFLTFIMSSNNNYNKTFVFNFQMVSEQTKQMEIYINLYQC